MSKIKGQALIVTPALDEAGIDLDTACNLENTFAFEPPLTIQSNNSDDLLTGPEDISVDEIEAEIDALKKQNVVERFKDVDIDGPKILEGNVYNFDELARVEAGIVLKSIDEEFLVIDHSVRVDKKFTFVWFCHGTTLVLPHSASSAGRTACKYFCPQHYSQGIHFLMALPT
ncbi:hypothetical protein BDR04DRAFT_1150274 [Suillus decipiens]|nr:hypothetical protein BDR04DRAFT_1150274 [Suillus decipiens]